MPDVVSPNVLVLIFFFFNLIMILLKQIFSELLNNIILKDRVSTFDKTMSCPRDAQPELSANG